MLEGIKNLFVWLKFNLNWRVFFLRCILYLIFVYFKFIKNFCVSLVKYCKIKDLKVFKKILFFLCVVFKESKCWFVFKGWIEKK